MKRECFVCHAEIKECMGFVVARDFVLGEKNPRELCGKCGFVALFWPEPYYEILRLLDLSK